MIFPRGDALASLALALGFYIPRPSALFVRITEHVMRISILRITLCCLVISVLANSVVAKDWRGIVPLKSTLADVERLLGPTPAAGYYNLADEIVAFKFQTQPCDSFGFRWNVPPGTVTEIAIIPKGIHRKHEYQLAGDSKVDDNGFGFVYYWDNNAGLMVETYKEIVTLVDYYPKSSEEPLRCPRIETCCVDFTKFDEYGDIKFGDVKARVDNFLFQINALSGRGTIEVVGPSPKIRAQLMKRAARAKDYLVKRRGLEPQRLLILDGGFEATPYTRLSVYPIGKFPTIYLDAKKDPQ